MQENGTLLFLPYKHNAREVFQCQLHQEATEIFVWFGTSAGQVWLGKNFTVILPNFTAANRPVVTIDHNFTFPGSYSLGLSMKKDILIFTDNNTSSMPKV